MMVDFELEIPRVGCGRHMRRVMVEVCDEQSFIREIELMVWFAKRPRKGSRFEFQGTGYRLGYFDGVRWVAAMVH